MAYPNFPVEEYAHELDWLEGRGGACDSEPPPVAVLKFKARLKAARKKLKKAKKQATPEAVLQEAGLPSGPGQQQQHGATPMAAEDESPLKRSRPQPPAPAEAAPAGKRPRQ